MLRSASANLANPWIGSVHVFYADEDALDNFMQGVQSVCADFAWLNGIRQGVWHAQEVVDYRCDMEKIVRVSHGRRATFREVFSYAEEQLRGEKVIVSNNDIFFDRTLSTALMHDFQSSVLALLRWEIQLRNQTSTLRLRADSQDAWIFRPPLPRKVFQSNFYFGKLGADNRLARIFFRMQG